jgi:hypothetical protein
MRFECRLTKRRITPVCTLRGGNVAPRAASVSACKLVRQEQFLYFPVLKCMYLNLLQINFYKKMRLIKTNLVVCQDASCSMKSF